MVSIHCSITLISFGNNLSVLTITSPNANANTLECSSFWSLNGSNLSYIGDAYYELEIRKYLLSKNINTLTFSSQFSVALKAQNDYDKACKAWEYEKVKDYKNAIKKWGEIFGSDFPKYGW